MSFQSQKKWLDVAEVDNKAAIRSMSRKSQMLAQLPPPPDSWRDPPDPEKKAISIDSECADGATVVADLLKNISKDPYSEDEAELQFLYSKPSCFLILGKPGVGKTSLARRFAAEWKCQIINSTDIILENMELQTDLGLKCVEILNQGGAVPDEMVLKMIEDKINSPEVAHLGYVLDDFPCLSEDILSIKDQLELIKSWKLKPDFIINIRNPEKDIERRRLDQMVDPFTGVIYTKEVYAPDKPIHAPADKKLSLDKEVPEVDDDEVEQLEQEVVTEEDDRSITELPTEVVTRLVKRPEDMPQQVAENLAKFRTNMLRVLEDYMGDHDQQYLVELDGNQPASSLLKQLMQKLQTFVLHPAAVVTRLTDPEDDDISDDMDTDDLMRTLGPRQMVAPRYRWRRSRWLRNCPVALYEGSVIPGKAEFAVSFLDKMYCLSSAEALDKFMRNPRPYLVPKQPRTPCKISVVGQPFSGKTTLCYLLAHYYGAKVFDIHDLATKFKLIEKQKQVEEVRRQTTESAIQEVKNRIRAQLQAEALEKAKELQARLAAEAEAMRLEQERLTQFEDEDSEHWPEGNKNNKDFAEDVQSGETKSTGQSEDEKEDTKSPSDTKEEETKEKKTDSDSKSDEEEKDTEGQGEAEDVIQEEGGEKEQKESSSKEAEEMAEDTSEEIHVIEDEGGLQIEIPEPEVDETHPEVKAIVNVNVSLAEIAPIQLTPEFEAEVLEMTIQNWEKELRSTRHDGPLHGCWILDNFPETPEQWNACLERNIIPDTVYVLGEEIRSIDINKLRTTCERYCLKNRDAIFAEMNRRILQKELKNQEARIEAERQKILDEENMKKQMEEERIRQKLIEEEVRAAEMARQEALERDAHDETTADTIPADEDDALGTPVQVPSNVLDDNERGLEAEEVEDDMPESSDNVIPEKTELEILMGQPEAKAFMEKLLHFNQNMGNLLATIAATSSVVAFRIPFENYTIEMLLETVVKNEEKQFRYICWELGQADIDEEEEDLEAEAAEAENEEEGNEGEEEEEDPNRSMKKFLGDSSYFDAVTLKESDILYPGSSEQAAVYREKIYFFSSSENKDKFIEEPSNFLSVDEPLKVPPLRLLILGPRGAGKTLNGNYLAEKLGIFHICYRERLQELIIAKTKKKIGPEFDEADEESLDESETETTGVKDVASKGLETYLDIGSEDFLRDAAKQDDDGAIPEEEEVELTDDEEAIKAYLESNEPLPTELLDTILKTWWMKEPYKSTGFVLEGFPRTAEEARYLQESGLFPDAAILLQVTENDVFGRLLPPKLDIWRKKRNRRLARRARNKARTQAKRNASIARRREALIKERDEKRARIKTAPKEALKEDDEVEEAEEETEAEEDEEEDIEAILAEEFEEEEEAEEEEEEELEQDAVERMKNDINDIYSDDNDRIAGVMDTLEEILIPCLDVSAGRKPHIVRYIINKKLKSYVDYRHSLFERVYPISERLAKRMLQVGYKRPSRFGRWDPVLLMEGNCIQPMSGPDHPAFACIYRSHIYFLSSQQNRLSFMQDALTYLKQESPKPVIPLRIAIIGPPKSGKTTLANRFVEDYGITRLSIGEAMRIVLTQQPKSELAQQMKWNLTRGRVVPDELQIQALDVALLDVRCQTRGYVLDGFPMTLRQIELMTECSIIPVRVIELELNSKEVLVRGVKDRLASTRTTALHDSSQVLAIKLSCYQRTVAEVRTWYQTQHQNYTIVQGDQSKWGVLDAVNEIATSSIKRIQDYMHRTNQGKAAGIYGLCITPQEFRARLGEFDQYCPVSLGEWDELVDCSGNETLEYAAEFRGHYYKLAGPKELEMFLKNPEKYIQPFAPRKLPPPEELPHRISQDQLGTMQAEILGYCPVTYLDGNLRYEALVPGSPEFAILYKGKLYLMESEEKLTKFMKQPEKYANLTLPHKLPPAPEDMPLRNLPMLGFMEQTCAVAMIKALTAAGNVKPKYPFVSSTRSALIYVAYHLKAFNPKSSPYIRKKYKQKLQQFQETCELIKYLGNNMTVRYRDPNERPKDFDTKLEMFFALKGVEPTPTWLK